MKKMILCLSVVSLIAILNVTGIEATNTEDIEFKTSYSVSDEDSYIYYDESNPEVAYYFDTVEDYNAFLNYKRSSMMRTSGSYTTSTKISSSSAAYQWIGYHSGTPNWAKASGYSLSKSKGYSASGSYNYSGTTVGVSYTATVTTSFTADSSRYSRLGVWGDLLLATYRVDQYDKYTGRYITSWNVKVATVKNYYIKVKYK